MCAITDQAAYLANFMVENERSGSIIIVFRYMDRPGRRPGARRRAPADLGQ